MTRSANEAARERVSVDRGALEVVRELADMGALYRAPGAVAGLIASARPLPPASALPLAEYLALADDLIAVRDETAGGGNRDTITRAAEVIRILCSDAAPPAAPAVDRAAVAHALFDLVALPSDDLDMDIEPEDGNDGADYCRRWRAVNAQIERIGALVFGAAPAAADDALPIGTAGAYVRGRADALAEVDAAAMACWTESPDGEVHLSRSNAGWFIESPTLWTPSPDDDALTPTAAILAAAAALADAPTGGEGGS